MKLGELPPHQIATLKERDGVGYEEIARQTLNVLVQFGLSPEQQERMLAKQKGVCAICRARTGCSRSR